MASEIVLSYKLKLFPTRNKADTLALLSAHFRRLHSDATHQIVDSGKWPTSRGLGEFVGRAYRRAWTDWKRTTKAGHQPGSLKAELIDAAHVQAPRKATGFDLWVMIQGVGKLYIPAKKHRAINRTLALPGATLCEQGEVFRKNRKWYVRVGVKIPLPEEQPVTEWLGVDVGERTSVARSDGYKGPSLTPILKRARARRAMLQKHGIDESRAISPQRQLLAKEARRTVLVAQKSGRGIAVEDPKRLIRRKDHAARYYGTRVVLLASVMGVATALIDPPYTSTTCSRCGSVEKRQRHRELFRCWQCKQTLNADFNASRVIAKRATRVSCES